MSDNQITWDNVVEIAGDQFKAKETADISPRDSLSGLGVELESLVDGWKDNYEDFLIQILANFKVGNISGYGVYRIFFAQWMQGFDIGFRLGVLNSNGNTTEERP